MVHRIMARCKSLCAVMGDMGNTTTLLSLHLFHFKGDYRLSRSPVFFLFLFSLSIFSVYRVNLLSCMWLTPKNVLLHHCGNKLSDSE